MKTVVVGVGDGKCSRNSVEVLTTYGLGSCIAVAFYDQARQIGGLLHYMLPDSSIDREKARRNPYMFADTGVMAMVQRLREMGAPPRRLSVRIAGGATVLQAGEHFSIGKRNHIALRKILWRAGLMIQAEEVGGSVSRNVSLEVGSGRCWWRQSDGKRGELGVNAALGGAA